MHAIEALALQGVDRNSAILFLRYHAAHPQIWTAYKAKVFNEITAGRKRVSSKAVFEDLRRELATRGPDGFVADNRFASCYSRLFAARFPEHAGLFEFRPFKGISERRAA